jgi:RNA polymerase sigma factor (sigma-70 family)
MPPAPVEPAAGPFPRTRHSVLEAVRGDDEASRRRACEVLAAAYWKPVYKYVRLRWSRQPEDAEDLTQGFFAAAFEKGFFERFDPGRARFRTYLRTCLDGFVSKQHAAARAQKRGGAVLHLSLDFVSAEGELTLAPPASDLDLEEYFHREWMRGLFEQAVARLRERCAETGRQAAFAVFERYDLDPGDVAPTYAKLGRELGLPVTQVTNHLSAMRRELRRHLLEALRDLCASDEEFRHEARLVLGREP